MPLPLGQWPGGIGAEMATAAFASEQAGLKQQTAGQQTVADIQEQIQIAAVAVFQGEGLIA